MDGNLENTQNQIQKCNFNPKDIERFKLTLKGMINYPTQHSDEEDKYDRESRRIEGDAQESRSREDYEQFRGLQENLFYDKIRKIKEINEDYIDVEEEKQNLRILEEYLHCIPKLIQDLDTNNFYIFDLTMPNEKRPFSETQLNTFIFTQIIGIIINIIITKNIHF
jgi:hypothetical protein